MSDACVIEFRGRQAGLVVPDADGVRFFAAAKDAFPLDGRTFRTALDASSAVRGFLRSGSGDRRSDARRPRGKRHVFA